MDRFMDLNRPIKQFVLPKKVAVEVSIENRKSSQTAERAQSGTEYSFLELEKQREKLEKVNTFEKLFMILILTNSFHRISPR